MTFYCDIDTKKRGVSTASVISRQQKMPSEFERYRERRNPRDRALYNWKEQTRVFRVEKATNMGVVGPWASDGGRKRHEARTKSWDALEICQ